MRCTGNGVSSRSPTLICLAPNAAEAANSLNRITLQPPRHAHRYLSARCADSLPAPLGLASCTMDSGVFQGPAFLLQPDNRPSLRARRVTRSAAPLPENRLVHHSLGAQRASLFSILMNVKVRPSRGRGGPSFRA